MPLPHIFYSESFLNHQTLGHPESPERLKSILKTLDNHNVLSRLSSSQPAEIDLKTLYTLHPREHVEHIKSFSKTAGNGQRIDEDTVVSEGSYQAAIQAAGSSIEMIDRLLKDKCQNVFSFVRPPGHHAMPDHTMGFCLFNNIALAARYAIDNYGLERILILDWDAHHGNATEHMFYEESEVLFVSWHQDPNWPGTGAIDDIGSEKGVGYNINIPLPIGYGKHSLLKTFDELIVPISNIYKPQLILVSAGYDSHYADPLTQMGATANVFGVLTEKVMQLADRWCDGRVGFMLEGGYHLSGLSYSVLSTVLTLINEQATAVDEPTIESDDCDESQLNELIVTIKQTQPLFKI